MTTYETIVLKEIQAWKQKQLQRPGFIKQLTKQTQNKINGLIPAKVHQAVTVAVKGLVKTTLAGSNLLPKKPASPSTLYEQDQLLKEKLNVYRKTAVAEGAGTGFGGILLGLADFPLILSIKMKFLYEAAAVYGYDTRQYEERLFLLHVFQFAFSNNEKRREHSILWKIGRHGNKQFLIWIGTAYSRSTAITWTLLNYYSLSPVLVPLSVPTPTTI